MLLTDGHRIGAQVTLVPASMLPGAMQEAGKSSQVEDKSLLKHLTILAQETDLGYKGSAEAHYKNLLLIHLPSVPRRSGSKKVQGAGYSPQ